MLQIMRSKQSSLPTDDEIHVAQILLHISSMISTPPESLRWGAKKRRSGSDSPHRKTGVGAPAKAEMEAAATASPVTPLAFPRTESDESNFNRHSTKISRKRSRAEYFDMIEELSQRREMLRGEIESVTNYYNKLIAQNSQLNAMKQEALNSWPRKEEPEWESSRDGNRTVEIPPRALNGPTSAQLCNGLGSSNRVGPTGIPDLNVCAEEIYQPLDWSGEIRRARCAEARRRRRDIIRVRSMRLSAPCAIKCDFFPRIR